MYVKVLNFVSIQTHSSPIRIFNDGFYETMESGPSVSSSQLGSFLVPHSTSSHQPATFKGIKEEADANFIEGKQS